MLQTRSGKSRDEVVQVLVARGWPEVSAVRFVDMTLFEQGKSSPSGWASDKEQRSARRPLLANAGSRKALLVAALIIAVLVALVIAGMLSILT